MAWRKLIDGDCSDESALSKLSSYYTKDHTFSEFHNQPFSSTNHSELLVQEFLQETQAIPQTFRMSDLMKEMQEIESQRLAIPPIPASKVKDQLHLNDSWTNEYLREPNVSAASHFNQPTVDHSQIWAEISAREQDNLDKNMFLNENKTEYLLVQDLVKDEKQQEYLEFVDFMKKMNVEQGVQSVGLGDMNVNNVAEHWTNEYISKNGKVGTSSVSDLDFAWDEEVQQFNNDKNGDTKTEFWDKLQDEWKKIAEQSVEEDHPWLDDLEDYSDPYKEYKFVENNSMMAESDPLEKGKRMLEVGNFPSAVLCFEAAVQKSPENADAWLLLGTTQAENEQDSYAISALKKCIQIQPDNLKAHMALSVCYTNENYHNQACNELVEWLRHNPTYADLVPSSLELNFRGQVTSLLDPVQHRTVEEFFIKAAQRQPTNPDSEVQCGLGILFNLSGEYDKAIDCFRVALTTRPDDARLWNRLGATLANGNRPEEAVEAYHRALNLFPGFIRARYNVGITCINLGAYKEAAEHFLIALNQQSRGETHTGEIPAQHGSHMSDTIWSTLRMCVSLLNQLDLRPYIENRDLNALNKAFNIDNK